MTSLYFLFSLQHYCCLNNLPYPFIWFPVYWTHYNFIHIWSYLGHIEFIGCKEYYWMPRGHELASVIMWAFRTNFSLFSKKKIVVPCLDVMLVAFFPKNIHWSSLFARKARVNTERVPPGHPIILLKANKFNMATVSVKRSTGQVLKMKG